MPESGTVVCPGDRREVAEAIRSHARLRCRGAGSQGSLATAPEGETVLDLSNLTGLVDYDPQELTFTAHAGTPVTKIREILGEHGQYLPFDPLWVERGATLGGVVAGGLAGAGSYGFGGVRDFLIGMRWIDGQGNELRGGGRVVKNAAGFDTPKLFVGSLGALGGLVEVTFKVFPRPESRSTWQLRCDSLGSAVGAMAHLAHTSVQIDAVELEAPSTLWCRLVGASATAMARGERLLECLKEVPGILDTQPMEEEEGDAYWRNRREVRWSEEGDWLFKIPITPKQIEILESHLSGTPSRRIYGRGGQVLWLAWSAAEWETTGSLRRILESMELAALRICGPAKSSGGLWTGPGEAHPFWRRLRQVYDPHGKFRSLEAAE